MNCEEILNNYIHWVKDNTSIRSIQDGKACEIITPLLDRHNDHIEIYVIKEGSKLKLTDDGYTISDLAMSGMEINTQKREKILKTILNGFGVKTGKNKELYLEADINNIGEKKHYLLQAILSINDMYVMSQENVYSLFKEDVELFFKSKDIIYSKDIKLSGKAGIAHNIDFLIPKSKSRPERLIKIINNPKRDNVTAAIFALNDITQIREQGIQNFIIHNDSEKKIKPDVLSAMVNYKIKSVPWSEKEGYSKFFMLN